MGACREPGVTVLIAIGTYVGYNSSAVIQFSMAAVMPTYSFWLLLSGEMHFEMIWEPGQMLEKRKFYFWGGQPLVLIWKKGALASLGQFGRASQWQSIPCFLPPISFSLPSQPLGHMLLPHCPASAWQTKGSHVPCGWSRKSNQKGWSLNSSNHDRPMESWSETLIVWSGRISDKSLCKRILNIQILRNLHSNVSYHYICYKWLVVKHTLFPNLALM